MIKRSAVVRVVDGGLGRWLGEVELEPERINGRFKGWRIDRLYPEDPCYASVDVRPGDVVVRVNGLPVERDAQAFAVFTALRTASALQIDILRDGIPRTVTFGIEAD